MRIVWNKKEREKIKKISKIDRETDLKLWRLNRWFQQNYEQFYNELIDVVEGRTRLLEKSDFNKLYIEIGDPRHYFHCVCVNKNYQWREINIEPCAGGFCVGIYTATRDLIEPKVCVDDQDIAWTTDVLGLLPRSKEVWKKALEIANSLAKKHEIIGKVELRPKL